jgi:uncharacterized protein YgbK (DUF1537 family)
MTSLRLLADDLTGALDTAAELVPLTGTVPVFWHGAVPRHLPANAALDSGTRELNAASAARAVAALTPALVEATVSFKKIDSLMRGPTLAEAAACVGAGGWERAVFAPAFPYQGRVTRGGVQHARDAGGLVSAVGGDIVAQLRGAGVPARRGRHDAPLPRGVSVFDAETEEDLARVAALGRAAEGPVLWIGTGGLAQALAGGAARTGWRLPAPLLGLFGSDQAVTAAQLAACGADWIRLRDGGPAEVMVVSTRLQETGRVLASLDLPPGLARDAAARRIATGLHRLIGALPPPGTLLVAGGETLRGLCLSLQARHLDVQGRIVPGLPVSVLRGGLWDGVTVVSKSGAFGHPALLRELCAAASISERMA